MAFGVKKTYIKQYRQNLRKAIQLLVEEVDLNDNLDNIFNILKEEYKLVPTLSDNEEYKEKESEYLKEVLSEEKLVLRVQELAEKNG